MKFNAKALLLVVAAAAFGGGAAATSEDLSAPVPPPPPPPLAKTDDDDADNIKPTVCVTLNFHPDRACKSEPIGSVSFPTFTEPGKSGCYTDSKNKIDVSDQYCNMDTGNYHQVVYPEQSGCDESNIKWYMKWIFPMYQTFTTDGCLYAGSNAGVSLQSCVLGPCQSADSDNDEDPTKQEGDVIVRGDKSMEDFIGSFLPTSNVGNEGTVSIPQFIRGSSISQKD